MAMKLSDLYHLLTVPEREALAKKAETTPGYLYQLATQWRGKKPSLEMIQTLTSVDCRLTVSDLVCEFLGQPTHLAPEATEYLPNQAQAPANQAQAATETVAGGG